jgi:hypothetical protein
MYVCMYVRMYVFMYLLPMYKFNFEEFVCIVEPAPENRQEMNKFFSFSTLRLKIILRWKPPSHATQVLGGKKFNASQTFMKFLSETDKSAQ